MRIVSIFIGIMIQCKFTNNRLKKILGSGSKNFFAELKIAKWGGFVGGFL